MMPDDEQPPCESVDGSGSLPPSVQRAMALAAKRSRKLLELMAAAFAAQRRGRRAERLRSPRVPAGQAAPSSRAGGREDGRRASQLRSFVRAMVTEVVSDEMARRSVPAEPPASSVKPTSRPFPRAVNSPAAGEESGDGER
jgi:hypothetical protein